MPDPLLTCSLYQAFLDVPRLASQNQLRALRLLCSLLPMEHLEVLRVLLSLLSDIAICAHEQNGSEMDSHNLAVVMAPNILRKVRRCRWCGQHGAKRQHGEGCGAADKRIC